MPDRKPRVSPRESKKKSHSYRARQDWFWRKDCLFTMTLEFLKLGSAVVDMYRQIAETSWFHSGYYVGLYSLPGRPGIFWGHWGEDIIVKTNMGIGESSLGPWEWWGIELSCVLLRSSWEGAGTLNSGRPGFLFKLNYLLVMWHLACGIGI